ncbi:hypothetical protein [Alkalicoccus urumqiensis]|nr:hypothetical protein [Alkalicoccus urumqiensis]
MSTKNTKQFLGNYEDVPNNIIGPIIDTSRTLKAHATEIILRQKSKMASI